MSEGQIPKAHSKAGSQGGGRVRCSLEQPVLSWHTGRIIWPVQTLPGAATAGHRSICCHWAVSWVVLAEQALQRLLLGGERMDLAALQGNAATSVVHFLVFFFPEVCWTRTSHPPLLLSTPDDEHSRPMACVLQMLSPHLQQDKSSCLLLSEQRGLHPLSIHISIHPFLPAHTASCLPPARLLAPLVRLPSELQSRSVLKINTYFQRDYF